MDKERKYHYEEEAMWTTDVRKRLEGPWRIDSRDVVFDTNDEVWRWCNENLNYEPKIIFFNLYFESKDDAVLFKLRWC